MLGFINEPVAEEKVKSSLKGELKALLRCVGNLSPSPSASYPDRVSRSRQREALTRGQLLPAGAFTDPLLKRHLPW